MIDWTEIEDGETWELFARDFLVALGFVVETEPGRGPDAGKDLLVSEQLRGKLSSRKFSWLVSCKHFATRGKSVGLEDETSILERLRQHKADGFIGFYSTVASSALITRLEALKSEGEIEAYEVFDGRKIEGHFVTTGHSRLALRYIPKTYTQFRPIQDILEERVELKCTVCQRDLLVASVTEPYSGIIAWKISADEPIATLEVAPVCKGKCDKKLQDRWLQEGCTSAWEDIGDLVSPITFLRNILSYTNVLHGKSETITPKAHEQMKHVYIALAQRVLRETTLEDQERFKKMTQLEVF